MPQPQILVFDDKQQLGTTAAELVCQLADSAVSVKGWFSLLLAGGSTPRTLYGLLASERFSGAMPWENTHLFWGDERMVGPGHPESNYRMVREAMIDHVPLPAGNVYPVPTAEAQDAADAAGRYALTIEKFFAERGAAPEQGEFPRFDLVLLGIGSDGHTASLFPGGPELNESKSLTAAVRAPAGYATTERVSVTLPVINAAAYVLFMATGQEKRLVLESVLDPADQSRTKYPSALVAPADGRLLWYLDRDAAPENAD